MRVLAIGDIHGCVGALKELLGKILPTKDDKLVLLGDYVDRGSNSKAVLDELIGLRNNGFDIVSLRGNHEQMMLNAYLHPERQLAWMRSGGWETVKSFNCNNVKDIPPSYIQYLSTMPLYFRSENKLFVHAGFNEYAEAPYEDQESMLWARIEQYHTKEFKSKTVVHGHTPKSLQELRKELLSKNTPVINLDTGCVYTGSKGMGHLTAYDFTNEILYHVSNKDN